MLCAPAQAAIGIEIMESNELAASAVMPLNHGATHIAVTAERAFLRALDGSCRTAIAALASLENGHLKLRGERYSDDGQKRWVRDGFIHKASVANAQKLGAELGESILTEMDSE